MNIRIRDQLFHISEPYHPGPYELSPAEAHALNTIRADNIRNNLSRKSRPLSLEEVLEYDSKYSFGQRITSQSSTIQSEIRRIALLRAEESGRLNGLTSDQIQSLAERLMLSPEVIREAQRNLEVQKEVGQQILAELLS